MNRIFALLSFGAMAPHFFGGIGHPGLEIAKGEVGGIVPEEALPGFGPTPADPQESSDPWDPCKLHIVECTVTWKADTHECKRQGTASSCTSRYQGVHATLDAAKAECERVLGAGGESGVQSCGPCHDVQCTSSSGDIEACKKDCDHAWERCRDICPRGDKNCLNECSQALGRCLKDCDNRYKR